MKFHHVGLAVKDISVSARNLRNILGFSRASEVIFDPIQKVNVLFMVQKGTDLKHELIEPVGSDSPAHQWLKRRTPLYHLCYEVKYIENTIEKMRREGCLLIRKPVFANAFLGKRAAFLMTPENLIIELVEGGKS